MPILVNRDHRPPSSFSRSPVPRPPPGKNLHFRSLPPSAEKNSRSRTSPPPRQTAEPNFQKQSPFSPESSLDIFSQLGVLDEKGADLVDARRPRIGRPECQTWTEEL